MRREGVLFFNSLPPASQRAEVVCFGGFQESSSLEPLPTSLLREKNKTFTPLIFQLVNIIYQIVKNIEGRGYSLWH